jgi:hypothetical protein
MLVKPQKPQIRALRPCGARDSKLHSSQAVRGKRYQALLLPGREPRHERKFSNLNRETRKSRKKYVREDEAIAVEPVGVLWVESHEFVPDNVSHRGHAHRGARMARVGLESGIDLKHLKNQQLTTTIAIHCVFGAAFGKKTIAIAG